MHKWVGKAVMICLGLAVAGLLAKEIRVRIGQNVPAEETFAESELSVLWNRTEQEDTQDSLGDGEEAFVEEKAKEDAWGASREDAAGNVSGEETGDYDVSRKVALTFDDGPHPSYTAELLDGLKERGVRASFFVLGEHAQLHPDIVRRMQEEGHLIGNHTYSHMQLKDCNWEEYRKELIKTSDTIREITGAEVVYVRPPYGCWDSAFEEELNMFPVLWNVDSRDWCSQNTDEIVGRVLHDTEEGDIILMHDYYDTSVEAALQVVDELKEEGYSFVTVEEILFD